MFCISLARNTGQLKIHEAIVSGIGDEISRTSGCNFNDFGVFLHSNFLKTASGGSVQKIQDGLPHVVATVRVGHQINIFLAMLEDAALQDFGLWALAGVHELPFRCMAEECFHAVRGAP